MIKDKEGHEVHLMGEANGHKLIYGNSGQGKTFFLMRELESYCEQGKTILILDYSGSFTEKEMVEKKFLYPDKVKRFNLDEEESFQWTFCADSIELCIKNVADALGEVLNCGSYYQKKLLEEAVRRTVESGNGLCISRLLRIVEEMLLERQINENAGRTVENLQHLLTRLFPYEDIDNFVIRNQEAQIDTDDVLTILDISCYPEGQRRFLTKFIVSLLWREAYRPKAKSRYEILALDEMQFLSVKEGSTLNSMLHEGRKKGLSLLLSTQYISHYGEDEKSALHQADTKIIFRPTPEDRRYSARVIAPMNPRIWERELEGLKKGEALLKGHYRLDNRNRILDTPLIIKAFP